MAIDAALVVRTGGALALLVVGVLTWWRGPRGLRAAFGTAFVAFGFAYVAINVGLFLGDLDAALVVQSVAYVALGAALFAALARSWRSTLPRPRRVAVGGAFLAYGLALVAAAWIGIDAFAETFFGLGSRMSVNALRWNFVAAAVAVAGAFGVTVLAAQRARTARDASERRALAWLGFSLSVFWAYDGLTIEPDTAWGVLTVAGMLASVVAWIPRASEPGGRWAWLVVWGLPAASLVAVSLPLSAAVVGAVPGIVRSFAALAAALALLSGALEERRGPRAPGLPRGALAASALAVLFVVAQIAQNFLEAQYGLLMGGIVAGAFLFAAHPIQRAIEQRGGGSDSVGAPQDERSTVFRDAARRYLRDGAMTREEELQLLRLARHLGIPHEDAARIRHELEDEARQKEAR